LANTDPEHASAAEPLIFIPHLYGGLSPDWHSESRGSILGLTLSHTPSDIRLAIMRGMAFEARRNLGAAEAVCGRSQSVRMVGGAGKSQTWPQMIANVLNRPVEVPECVESACYGAAKLAAGAISERWTGMEPKREFTPVAGDVQMASRLFGKYLRFYEALLPVYGDEA
jgi:sugar (pentulose or hexulose) kinase